ncbi:MAG: hypothetical protein A3B25_01635 [Candidatus Ryanbacteria bacterium RIFCSPLOWO2_01_FULL_48_26]|uniref:Uncharacterized protein n=1 Tax=Candidatus Ryanbacteria bacterium RIFCSPLOWO2_01_FULL_48_26 TaxID=1802126 RepID=A0A1G2GXN6_9BACT|nr:MAG: hypothetical protein A3B25_01635 [Candidatus Ryanbacteria bacterium RIFCSPLOWO2_01_FULL_48_26]
MKLVFTVFVMGSFFSIAVFGIFAMNHGGEHSHGCIAVAAQGVADCPNQATPIAFLAFHLDAFKSFSTATIGTSFASPLLVAFALILAALFVLFFSAAAPAFSRLQAYRRKRHESFELPFHLQLNRWLALHENSPSVI